jgi:hypothetical protein
MPSCDLMNAVLSLRKRHDNSSLGPSRDARATDWLSATRNPCHGRAQGGRSLSGTSHGRKCISALSRLRPYPAYVNIDSRSGNLGMASDEEVARQILSIFMRHKVVAGGLLRRNHFIDVRDADFQRGLNNAVENHWLRINLRDRYRYELTDAGLAAGLEAGISPGR